MADLPCPCGHDLGGDYACLNGRIYGPCGEESCIGPCSDTYGYCKSLDGCRDTGDDDD